jgi:tetratricopeptide (TPR) repeat protein
MPPESAVAGHALSRGRPLADAVAEYRRAPSPLGLHDLLRHFVAACYEIAYAHSRGATHLGLTPRLILLGDFGETAVVGWDRARPTPAANGAPAADPDAYAAAFQAPEQAAGRAGEVGPASDVYALGAILYFILSGRPPHEGATAAEVLARVRDALPWQPRMVAAGVPAALEAVCLTALERQPPERYASAAELAREVERWMAGEPVRTNYVEPRGVRLARWARGRYGLLALTGLSVLGLVGLAVLGLALYTLRQDRHAAREEAQRVQEAIREKDEEISRQRALSREEFAAAVSTLRDFVLLAQARPAGDPGAAAFRAEALQRAYERARQMALRADHAAGNDPAAVHDRLALGELFAALARPEDARQQYERAVLQAREVARAHPESLAALSALLLSARSLAQLQLALHEPTAARMAARTALAAAEQRTQVDPHNVALQHDVAQCAGLIAEASIALHEWPAAREALDRVIALTEGYAKPDSPNLQDRFALADAYISRGRVEGLDHRYKDALAWSDRALAILRPLKAEGRLNPPSLALLDRLEKEAQEWQSIVRAVNDINVALSAPEDKALRLLLGRAAALARLGRPAEAAATAEKLRQRKPQDGINLYNVACCYALCVPAVGAGKPADALTAEERAARADYTARALKELRAAVDHGFRDVAHIESDPDFDGLRQEPGYRAIVAELKAVRTWLTFPVLP